MTQPPPPPNQPPGPPPNQPPGEPSGEQPQQPPAQPPAQPPSGGFGAPQDPPPGGGFGAPQDPPPGGGFGAPQGAGYGYPQTPPPGAPPAQPPTQPLGQAGYGYPGPPQPQQPQYGGGYPQPPTMPMKAGAPGPGGGKKSNPVMVIIVAAVVAVALIIGGGVWYASSQGDDDKKDESKNSAGTGGKDLDDKNAEDKDAEGEDAEGEGDDKPAVGDEKVPSNTESRVQFQLPEPKVDKDIRTLDVHGSWITDKVYAKSGDSKIVGYDPVKGSEQWTIELPGPVCGASRELTDDDKTAVLHQPDKPTKKERHHGCTEVTALDLEAGKKLWTKAAKKGDRKARLDEVTISGTTVAAGGTGGGAAWSIDGKALWAPKASDTCYDSGYGGGEALVTVRKCGRYGDRKLEVQTLNPASGAVLSSYELADGIEWAHVVSSKPLVVATRLDTEARGYDYFSIDNSKKKATAYAKITAPGDRYEGRCGATEVGDCRGQVVSDSKLYLPTKGESFGRSNSIVSFDLKTGKSTGDKIDAGEKWSFQPMRMDGDNILAYKFPPYDKGGQVVTIDPNTMKETLLLQNPAEKSIRDAETGFLFDHSEFRYRDGKLYLSAQLVSSSNYGRKSYLAVSFGAS
ncbi:outer membrane protein assembly factor BamB family protein [Streptomyces sp. O3]